VRQHSTWAIWRLARLSALSLALVLLAGPSGAVAAQESPPSTNSGPQFGQWGPGRQAPEPEGPSPGAPPPAQTGRLGAPAPGAPPTAPAPAPNTWGGCNYDLSGGWHYDGREVSPWPFDYSGDAQVTQYGGWLQATDTQSGSGAQTNYYGRCTGNQIRFDVYQGPQFVGYQYGDISWSPRFGLRVQYNWVTWDPTTGQQANGTESWR